MKMIIKKDAPLRILKTIALIACITLPTISYASNVNIVVTNAKDKPFESAVVFFEPQFKNRIDSHGIGNRLDSLQ